MFTLDLMWSPEVYAKDKIVLCLEEWQTKGQSKLDRVFWRPKDCLLINGYFAIIYSGNFVRMFTVFLQNSKFIQKAIVLMFYFILF